MNKPKIIGTSWETAVVRYLREHGFPKAERRALNGGKDLGDIVNVLGVIECKAEKQIRLAEYMKELLAEIDNAGELFGVAVIKRRQHGVADGYAVMPFGMYVGLLRRLTEDAA